MQPTPVFMSGEFRGQRSVAGYSSWDHKSRMWLRTRSCSTVKSREVAVNLYHTAELPGKPLQNEDLWVLIFKARLRTTALDLCFSNCNMLMNFITTQLVVPVSQNVLPRQALIMITACQTLTLRPQPRPTDSESVLEQGPRFLVYISEA